MPVQQQNQMQESGTVFKVGDMAFYPAQGVAEVVGIETKNIEGCIATLYVLKVLDTERKIFIPVDRVEQVGLRQVLDEKGIAEVYHVLRVRDVEIDTQTWNRRYRGYIDKIKTGSACEVAEVLRDLCLLRNDKTLSFGERKMLDMAKRLLIQELAVARNTKEDVIEEEIEEIFIPGCTDTNLA